MPSSHYPSVRLCPTAVLSASLAAAVLLVVLWLRAQGHLPALGLLGAVKESLPLSGRKTSLL